MVRPVFRFISAALLAIVVVPVGTIYRQNIENWATGHGLDDLLSEGADVMVSNPWGPLFLALFFMLLGSTVSLWGQHFFRAKYPKKFKSTLDIVSQKTFRHERVVIDGKRFVKCAFDGVTLVYQGTGLFAFEENAFNGAFSISVESEPAGAGLSLAKLSQQLGVPILFEQNQPQLLPKPEEGKPQ
jgi:hypothetical protein